MFRIDNDILNLMDEFDPDLLLRELSDSIGDSEKFIFYIKERTSLLIERFLVSLAFIEYSTPLIVDIFSFKMLRPTSGISS